MDISPIQPLLPRVEPREEPSESTASPTADFDSFLSLLTAQLRFQDPLQPLDSTQFVAQLASFSTVEQLIGSNDKLDSLIERSEAGAIDSYASWIGREVGRADGRLRSDGSPVSLGLTPNAQASVTVAQVMRSDGTVIRELQVPPGSSEVQWDGLDAGGNAIAGEDLTVIIEHFGPDGSLGRSPAEIFATVTGLRGGANGAELVLADGTRLDPSTVATLRMVPPAPVPADSEE